MATGPQPQRTVVAGSGHNATVTVFTTHLVLSGWEAVCYYYPPLTDGNNEAQRGPPCPPCHPSMRDVERHDLSPCMGGLGQQGQRTRVESLALESSSWGGEKGSTNLKMPNLYVTAPECASGWEYCTWAAWPLASRGTKRLMIYAALSLSFTKCASSDILT